MDRIYNFASGPACLPEEALQRAQKEMLNYNGTGMSVMEMSHRSPAFEEIIDGLECLVRELMGVPDNYKVLFLQGGACTQFSMVPLNLMCKSKKADFVMTGLWTQRAYEEASRYGSAKMIASSEDKNFTYVPALDPDTFTKDADYFYICYNNTVYGTRYTQLPETGDVPIVADLSSCILSEPIDVSRFGLVFACAQKNMGPSGLTVVIVRDDLANRARYDCPTMLKWQTQIAENSLYNTPPCFSTYVAMLVFRDLKEMGGVPAMERINKRKAKMLYDFIDNSTFYKNPVEKKDRSIMNVPFVTPTQELDDKFVKEASKIGLLTLKGHRLVGGMRASIYNAMPVQGVKKLVDFMGKFELANK